MTKRKSTVIAFVLSAAVLMSTFIGTLQSTYAKTHKNKNKAERVMQSFQSKETSKITIMQNGKKTKITNPYRIKAIQKALKRNKCVRRKKSDSLKGWIYTVTLKKKNGKSIKISIISDKLIRIRGKVYKVKSLNLKKLKYCYRYGNITPILENNRIESFTVQFRDRVVEITDPEKVAKTKELFKENKFQRIKNDGVKGWIYRITAKDKDNNVVQEIILINETRLLIGQKLYNGKRVDIDALDKILEINRYE